MYFFNISFLQKMILSIFGRVRWIFRFFMNFMIFVMIFQKNLKIQFFHWKIEFFKNFFFWKVQKVHLKVFPFYRKWFYQFLKKLGGFFDFSWFFLCKFLNKSLTNPLYVGFSILNFSKVDQISTKVHQIDQGWSLGSSKHI